MTLPLDAANDLELINACGPTGKQAWLCSTVHDITGSASAARFADDIAKPVRILLIVVVAINLVADHLRDVLNPRLQTH